MNSAIAIGGGLAGAAFALELARNGHRVVVLEKTRAPHHKVCGEFLNAETQRLIDYLGLDVWELGARSAGKLQLACREASATLELPFCGAGLSRFRLDEALLQAAARAGAEIVRGEAVTRLQWTGGAVVVRTARHDFHAVHAALATGKHDLRELARPRAKTVSFKMHLQAGAGTAATLRGFVRLVIFPGGYVGACLVEEGVVAMCWVLEQNALREIGSEWRSQASYLARQSHFIGEILSGMQPLWRKPVAVAAIPYGFLRRHVLSRVVYPLGDQLAVIPSYTGSGTSIALYSGIEAAQAILKSRPADEYQNRVVSLLKPRFTWAAAANFIITDPRAQRLGMAVDRLLPWAVPKLAAFVAGMTRLRAVEPA